jgi:hypothetical protein
MKEKRNLSPKTLKSDSLIGRARKLADASLPLVADLYLAHLQACADNQHGEKRKAPQVNRRTKIARGENGKRHEQS